jgi:flagellar hook-associated protein 1 FlgK
MSGLGLVLTIAKDALTAQQYGVFVTGQNIANVNTPGYSKQSAVQEARRPAPYGGVYVGRGVETTAIERASDQLIENRVMQQKSDLYSYEEMENYMLAMEGLFNESSGISLSSMFADFWNLWHDLSNNPSGSSERIALYENGDMIAEQFNAVDDSLLQLSTDLTNAMRAGVGRINAITESIAALNNEIVGIETIASANDLKDQRNVLAGELSEYMDIKIFEQSDGSFTIISQAKGVVLVEGNASYEIELDGTAVEWKGSGGNDVDITDNISTGKLGGWLEMRDEVVTKYRQDISELASEFIWMVNQQHSQGVGLKLIQPGNSVTGTYTTTTTLEDLDYGSAADGYVDYTGTLNLWIGDANGENLNQVAIDLDFAGGDITAASSLADLRDSINAQIAAAGYAGDVTAALSASGDAVVFTAGADDTFGFSSDTSNLLAALGINTFFSGGSAGGIEVNTVIGSDTDYIAAAQIDSTGSYGAGDNTNALAMVDKQYSSTDILRWTYDRINGNTAATENATIEDYYHAMVGALGIQSSSISRGRSFNEVMVQELTVLRETISSVSLDEEMTELVKYQQAFSAASKLFIAADEMFQELLDMK